jgi:hypothetical protein
MHRFVGGIMTIAEIFLLINGIGVLLLALNPILKRLAKLTKTPVDDQIVAAVDETIRTAKGLDDLDLNADDKTRLVELLAKQASK